MANQFANRSRKNVLPLNDVNNVAQSAIILVSD